MEPSWVSKMDIAPNWLPPKPSNQGPSVIGVEPPRRWPISCHGVGTMIWIKPYHGVCGFCGKRRLQQIEAYMNLWVSWVSTAFWLKTKGYHIVCWHMVYLHTRFAHSDVPLRDGNSWSLLKVMSSCELVHKRGDYGLAMSKRSSTHMPGSIVFRGGTHVSSQRVLHYHLISSDENDRKTSKTRQHVTSW